MSARSIAIETATDVCSVALADEGRIVAEASLLMPRRHAERLVPLIDSLLDHAGWTMAELDFVAVSAGPGSYTGLRIGVSTAKGLCFARDVPLIAVSTLAAYAHQVAPFVSTGDLVISSFDARRSSVYGAAFKIEADGRMADVVKPTAATAADFAGSLPATSGMTWLLGDGAALIAPHLTASHQRRLAYPPSASTVAAIAHERWGRREIADVASFEPLYLREFVAKKPAASAFEKLPF